MEKQTVKFLSVILSLAILLSFPVVSQAADADTNYSNTFTGTYTAPSSARNVLVSGSDATISEWYGDRVNMGGSTYSVRQNQYGLNKDGNMIDASVGSTYTIWLAQYGVASFKFTAQTDATYQFTASENETYGNAPSYNDLTLYDENLNWLDYGYGYYYDDEQSDAAIVYNISAGETVYLTAAASTAKDCVYNLSITEYSTDNCPHNWSYEDYEEDDCYEYEYYVCTLCGETKTETYEYHWWNYEYTHEAENCLDYSTGTRTCEECGKEEEFSEKGYNHTVASQEIDWIGNYFIEYVCTCGLCGETFYTYEDSPCVSYDEDEGDYIVSHSFGTTSSVPCGTQATCSVCGYVYESYHDYDYDTYDYDYSYEALNGSDTCYLYTWTETATCTKCGETITDTDSWESHSAWEYVQITPQHDNVCGTYNYCCAGCGAYEFEEPLTCHCYTTQTLEDGSTVKVCSRCGDVESTDSGDSSSADTGSSDQTANTPTVDTNTDTADTTATPAADTTVTVPAIKSVKLSKTSYVYNGKARKPSVIVKDVNGNIISSDNYTVTYASGRKKVGKYKVTVKFTGNYSGTYTLEFTIKPKSSKSTKLTKKSKAFKVTWKKVSGVTGYQVQYATNKKFTKNKKTVTVKGASKTSKTIKKLKSKKTYYVRVRTYKTVNGKKIYSNWSTVKKVKTK